MAYMNQDRKKELAAELKKALTPFKNKYGLRYTLAVRNHSTVVLTFTEGRLDFLKDVEKYTRNGGYCQVNMYCVRRMELMADLERDPAFNQEVREVLLAADNALHKGNHDKSDMMTDYYDVGWYVDINVGRWNKPYKFTGKTEEKAA